MALAISYYPLHLNHFSVYFRLLFAGARVGHMPSVMGMVHKKYLTPWPAIFVLVSRVGTSAGYRTKAPAQFKMSVRCLMCTRRIFVSLIFSPDSL